MNKCEFSLNLVQSKIFPPRSPVHIAGAPSKRKKNERKMQRRSLMRVRRSSRIVTRLYDADRLLQNDRATIHQNMWLGECGFCIAALYAISPPSHFGNASLPHWSVQSHRPRLLTVGLNCARRKAFSSFAVFRGRDSFSRTRYPFTNIFDMYPPSMFILLHSRRAFEALWSNCSLSVAWIAHVEKASSRFFFFFAQNFTCTVSDVR